MDEGWLTHTAPRAPRDGQQQDVLCPRLGVRPSIRRGSAGGLGALARATLRARPNAWLILARERKEYDNNDEDDDHDGSGNDGNNNDNDDNSGDDDKEKKSVTPQYRQTMPRTRFADARLLRPIILTFRKYRPFETT
ncbi:hypothetical protein PIB30_040297 [Stylosanthes scabra]|uniref:Uncharacterized protein n=1 Tax=Stylosanthes scabra TaxID=79078 RepID=A0ABU6ZD81_9FABA|nr:hypothetical protein [Stylosanthes scabra]